MNTLKKILVGALILSSGSNLLAANANIAPERVPGFFENIKNVLTCRNWDTDKYGAAKTISAYAIIAGIASAAIYKIVSIIKEEAEQEKKIELIKAKFEKFVAAYRQLLEKASHMAEASLEGKPVKETLYAMYVAQKNQNRHEFLDMITAHLGQDISMVTEKFVKDFDEVIATPAGNKKDRIMAAITNLAEFMKWLLSGEFKGVQVPAAEPVVQSVKQPQNAKSQSVRIKKKNIK